MKANLHNCIKVPVTRHHKINRLVMHSRGFSYEACNYININVLRQKHDSDLTLALNRF